VTDFSGHRTEHEMVTDSSGHRTERGMVAIPIVEGWC
jgi:hypothetical protein